MNTKNATWMGLAEIGEVKVRSSKDITASKIGVGFETLDRYYFEPEKCYDPIAESGAKWARCQTGWSRCEQTKGSYNFKWLDDVVDNLLRRGIKPWFNVGYGNKLYMPDANEFAVGCAPSLYGKEVMDAWLRYVHALTLHFKGRVHRYEIWNEANHTGFWRPGAPSAKEYTQLVVQTARVIKSADPDAFTSACCAGADSQFIVDTLRGGIGEQISAYAIHPYGNMPEWNYTETVAALRGQFRRFAPHLQLWNGECGCPSQALGHTDADWMGLFNMDETKQAKWALRRILLDLSLGLEHSCYFHTSDLRVNSDRPYKLGLLGGKDYAPKQAFRSFSGLCSLFDDETQVSPLSIHSFMHTGRYESKFAELAVKKMTFERGGYPLYAYYLPEDVQLETPPRKNFTIQVLEDATRKLENPVLVDLLQMKVFKLDPANSVAEPNTFPDRVTAFSDLPLVDYPLIITDRAVIE